MNLKDSRLKLPTSALRVRLLLALASIVLALMAMLTTAIPNLRGGGGGAEFVVVVMGLWALPHALYVIIIRTREMSKVAGLALLITTSFLVLNVKTSGSSTAALGYVFGHVLLDLIVIAAVIIDLVLRRRQRVFTAPETAAMD